MKVVIIGGGASGMLAALSAAEDPANKITLLERQARVGRKLLATGNGRCNLTNRRLSPANYHGGQPDFLLPALQAFGVDRTLDFFASLGLMTVTEPDGRVYPLSDQANSVVDVLRFALAERGVDVVCSCDVLSVGKKARGYQVTTTQEGYFADRLIVATGGCAGKKLGGTHAGYRLLGMLGHSCTPLHPSLVQIKTDPTWVRALKGVRADGRLSLKCDGSVVAECEGELQFTDFGVSGPVAFALSRAASTCEGEHTLLVDFLRRHEKAEILALLQRKRERFPYLNAEDFLSGMLQSRLCKVLVRRCEIDAQKPSGALTDDELAALAGQIKCFALPVEGVLGMDCAQVTAGGVPVSEFRPDTLESRLVPGVFATGELLDIDGDCGGYNLQWAWSSGHLAGRLGKEEVR